LKKVKPQKVIRFHGALSSNVAPPLVPGRDSVSVYKDIWREGGGYPYCPKFREKKREHTTTTTQRHLSQTMVVTLMSAYNSKVTEWTKYQLYIEDNYTHSLPILTSLAYLVMVFTLPRLLIRAKINLRGTILRVLMASWNLFLSVFSFVMVSAFLPSFSENVRRRGVVECICNSTYELFTPSPMTFWTTVFVFSKFAELLDTVFLIVKNPEKPVAFLHYYHHASVLLFSWYADITHYTPGLWSFVVNGTVHTIMYFYYFLTELGFRPKGAVVITTIQITQMVIGIIINAFWAHRFFNEGNCQCKSPLLMMSAALVMYASYLYLFLQFFFNKYTASPKKDNAAATKEKKE